MSESLSLILKTLSDKKADAIDLFDFSGGHFIHETMVVASASNPRLLDALCDYVTEALEKASFEIHHTEGTPDSGWILIDTPEILIHLFLQDTRDHYQLDVLWADKKAQRYAD